jgi:hypothetical protein
MSNSLIELPFYNVDLIQEFSFNNNLNLPTMKHLNSYSSMYDLGLFNIDTSTDTNVYINSSHQSILSQYYSPYKFAELKNSETKHIILNKSFSMLHNNVRSLNAIWKICKLLCYKN